MKRFRQAKKEMTGIGRREFCLTVPWATLGILAASPLWDAAKTDQSLERGFNRTILDKEENMSKSVKEIIATVVSQKGECGQGHKIGDVVKFTETRVEGKLCIHALYSMLPKVFAMMFNAQFPWAKDPDVLVHPCPDAANPVVFELKRIYEK